MCTAFFAVRRSIGFGQIQYALGNVGQNHLPADRRDAGNHDLAQIAFDMIFLGVAESAMRQNRLLARAESRLGAKLFRSIGLGPALLPRVVQPGRLAGHEVRRLKLHPVAGQWVLYRLILPDGPVKDDPVV